MNKKMSSESGGAEKKRACREAVLVGLSIFLMACISAAFFYIKTKQVYAVAVRTELLHLAQTAAIFIDADAHPAFISKEQEQGFSYQTAVEPLRRMIKAIPQIRFIYTTRNEGGVIHFVLDAALPGDSDHDGVEDHSSIMDPYDEASFELQEAFKTLKPTVSRNPYTDKWGTFISANVPFFDSNGNLSGVLGMDMTYAQYKKHMAAIQIAVFSGLLFPLVISIAISILVYILRYKILTAREQTRVVVLERQKKPIFPDLKDMT